MSGAPEAAVGLLGFETRRNVSALLAAGGRVKNGAVTLEQPGWMAAPGEIRSAVEGLLQFVEELPEASVQERLRRNAADDIPAVRLRNLELLAAGFAAEPQTRVAADAAVVDKDPAVRLLGAKIVRGERGKTALASLLHDAATPAEVLAEAIKVCADTHDAAFVEPLAQLARNPEVAAAVAAALGKLGDAKAEPVLLRLLAREQGDVRRSAAAALGQVGSVHAVEPLLEHGFKDAARRIQARLTGVEAGRLSIAQDDAAGALSPAVEEGRLSMVKTKA